MGIYPEEKLEIVKNFYFAPSKVKKGGGGIRTHV
jgi:hypothetical protein